MLFIENFDLICHGHPSEMDQLIRIHDFFKWAIEAYSCQDVEIGNYLEDLVPEGIYVYSKKFAYQKLSYIKSIYSSLQGIKILKGTEVI